MGLHLQDPKLHRPDARLELALAAPVAVMDLLGAAFVKTGSAALLHLQPINRCRT